MRNIDSHKKQCSFIERPGINTDERSQTKGTM